MTAFGSQPPLRDEHHRFGRVLITGPPGAPTSTILNTLIEPSTGIGTGHPDRAAITEFRYEPGPYRARIRFVSHSAWAQEMGRISRDVIAADAASRRRLRAAPPSHADLAPRSARLKSYRRTLITMYGERGWEALLEHADPSEVNESDAAAAAFLAGSIEFVDDDLARFMSRVATYGDYQGHLWPMVARIRLSGPFIGLISRPSVVQLPARYDMIPERIEITRHLLATADELWVAAAGTSDGLVAAGQFLTDDDRLRDLVMAGITPSLLIANPSHIGSIADEFSEMIHTRIEHMAHAAGRPEIISRMWQQLSNAALHPLIVDEQTRWPTPRPAANHDAVSNTGLTPQLDTASHSGMTAHPGMASLHGRLDAVAIRAAARTRGISASPRAAGRLDPNASDVTQKAHVALPTGSHDPLIELGAEFDAAIRQLLADFEHTVHTTIAAAANSIGERIGSVAHPGPSIAAMLRDVSWFHLRSACDRQGRFPEPVGSRTDINRIVAGPLLFGLLSPWTTLFDHLGPTAERTDSESVVGHTLALCARVVTRHHQRLWAMGAAAGLDADHQLAARLVDIEPVWLARQELDLVADLSDGIHRRQAHLRTIVTGAFTEVLAPAYAASGHLAGPSAHRSILSTLEARLFECWDRVHTRIADEIAQLLGEVSEVLLIALQHHANAVSRRGAVLRERYSGELCGQRP